MKWLQGRWWCHLGVFSDEKCDVSKILFKRLRFHHYLKVPPPVCGPHLTIFVVCSVRILVYFLRCIALLSLESRIPHELLNAFNRIMVPQFNIFCSELSILVALITLNAECHTCPLRSTREEINSLEKGSGIVKGRIGPVFNLSGEYNCYWFIHSEVLEYNWPWSTLGKSLSLFDLCQKS